MDTKTGVLYELLHPTFGLKERTMHSVHWWGEGSYSNTPPPPTTFVMTSPCDRAFFPENTRIKRPASYTMR